MWNDPQPDFRRTMKRSAIAHGILVAGLVVASFLQGCRTSHRPREIVTLIDLQAGPPPIEIPLPPQPEPPKPEPVKPPPDTDIPETLPEKPPKPRVEVQTNKVVRREQVPPAPVRKPRPITSADIRRALGQGPTLSASSSSDGIAIPSWYLSQIRSRMYEAWIQPGGLSAAGISAEAEIRVQKDGRIIRRVLTRRSGNETMDRSVQRAMDETERLPPLPSSVRESYVDIPILFQLQNAAL